MTKKKTPNPDKPLTAAEFKKMRWVKGTNGLPKEAQQAIKNSRGRPKLAMPKEHINIRLDADIAALLRGSGAGWQTRLNNAVREWLTH